MKSLLRLLLATFLWVLSAASCLADTAVMTSTGPGGAISTNGNLSSNFGGRWNESTFICVGTGDSNCSQDWHGTLSSVRGGLVWDGGFSQSNSEPVDGVDLSARQTRWAAADQPILFQGFDTDHDPWLNTSFGGTQAFDSQDPDDFHYRHPPRHPHPPHKGGDDPPPVVPEPSTLLMVASGFLVLTGLLRNMLGTSRARSLPAQ